MDEPIEGATRVQVPLRSETSLLDQALTRAGGAPLVRGNHVRILMDAGENYTAWLEAIHGAEERIYFENYFIGDDDTGAQFAAALAARARAGVRVRLIYDWLGSRRRAPHRFWRDLAAAGVDVRCFNPLQLQDPLAAVHRDHRKTIAIDGRIGFVSGLCVSREWVGDPDHGQAPWRDTGLELRGPAVHDVECAFAQVWSVGNRREPHTGTRGSASRAAAGALRVGRAVGAAVTRQRVLDLTEARLLAFGAGLLAVAALGALWPLLLAAPIIVLSAWLGAAFLARAYAMRRARRSLGLPVTRIGRTTVQSS